MSRHLFSRLSRQHESSNDKEPPSVTFQMWMQSSFYVLNNAFTQIDAYLTYRTAVQHLSRASEFDEASGTYVLTDGDALSPEDVAAYSLPFESFNNALRHSASLYKAATEGSELLDRAALPLASQEEADKFAATFFACLPTPIMFPIVEEAPGQEEEKNNKGSLGSKTGKGGKGGKGKKGGAAAGKNERTKRKENIVATLSQYISDTQLRLLSAGVLSEMEIYQHGMRQLFISYMTDDVLTGEPPSWSSICSNQLQLKPGDADTCCCALRITPDLVPHREFQALLLAVSPSSGCLLFSQFLELLWRCAAISPFAHDDVLAFSDSEILANLFHHAGMRADLPEHGGARRREDAMMRGGSGSGSGSGSFVGNSSSHDNSRMIPSSPVYPRSGFAASSDSRMEQYEDEYESGKQEVRVEVALRSLLDHLESNLNRQEVSMHKSPGFGFPAATELPRRTIERQAVNQVWHPMPCVVREVCRAPDAPLIVENLMEAALSYHNSSQYDLAINAYISARSVWLEFLERSNEGKRGDIADNAAEGGNGDGEDGGEEKNENKKVQREIPARASVFILCSIGSVHESAGNDEMALTCYLDAQRTALARLSHDDADMAVAYSHLGSVCYHLGRFTTASRCYRVAVSIRHHLLGPEHPDCAASHSSLGAALCMLGPEAMVEAMYNLKFAAKQLKRQLGPMHPRTVVATRNAERARCRPVNLVQQLNPNEAGKAPSRFVSGARPLTLGLRDDLSNFRPGGSLPGVSGAKAKGKKKGKKGGKKKGKKK